MFHQERSCIVKRIGYLISIVSLCIELYKDIHSNYLKLNEVEINVTQLI